MTTEYVWNGLRVRRNEQGQWQEFESDKWWDFDSYDGLAVAVAAELDKLYPLPIEPPESGTIVHVVGVTAPHTAEMTFIGVEPDETGTWIVRDGDGDLDRYLDRQLALGPRPKATIGGRNLVDTGGD